MKTMLFKKTILTALIAALILAALPLTGVSAAGQADPTPPAQGQISNERLENIWARMNRRYERLGRMFEKSDGLVERANAMIERLKEAGESTAELEAALAAYESAVKAAHPIYESCNGIVNSHKGFDADGKVTDAEQARETIQELGAKFGEIKTAMDGTGKALIELMKSIREAHKPADA
jgi:uncharacterized coiled-coil DUF342 family protein